MYTPDGVKQERTGWRDAWISQRHRAWGYDCPMCDIDFLAIEYTQKVPVALVEYKAARPFRIDTEAANYTALINASAGMNVPLLVVFYSPTYAWFYVHPLNYQALRWFGRGQWMSEREYVRELYALRGIAVPSSVADQLSDFKPEGR
jgi:hypothetical protein